MTSKKVHLREYAIAFLARREHSQYELKQKLLARGFKEAEIETVLAALAKEGVQSDARYAKAYVRQRVEKGFGPRRIGVELQERGITKTLIQQQVPNGDEFWWKVLEGVYEKKYSLSRSPGVSKKNCAKQTRFLIQRGFQPEQVARWLRNKDCPKMDFRRDN